MILAAETPLWPALRFWNDDVLRDIDDVCRHILTVAGLVARDAASRVVGALMEERR